MKVSDTGYSKKKEAGNAVLEACRQMQPDNVSDKEIGSYLGFTMHLTFSPLESEYVLSLKGDSIIRTHLGQDPGGVIIRINNALDTLPKLCEETEQKLEETRGQLEVAKMEVTKEFPREEEYQRKLRRLAELNALLNVDERNSPAQDAFRVAEKTGAYQPASRARGL